MILSDTVTRRVTVSERLFYMAPDKRRQSTHGGAYPANFANRIRMIILPRFGLTRSLK